MEQKSYRIKYSIMVNGEEYPNSVTMLGIDSQDAENNLKSRFSSPDVELVIVDIVPI